MGKKSKKTGSAKNGPVKLLPQTRGELTEIVDALFRKCTKVGSTTTPSQEWEEFVEIYDLIERIKLVEKDIKLPSYDRFEQVPGFSQWMKDNNVQAKGVEISDYGECGLGLRVTKGLEEGDPVIIVPKAVILSEETAKKSFLGSFIEKDPILQRMGNVALALHILGEYVSSDSFWAPYLRLLPPAYSTPLYFTIEQIQMLKGSPLMDDVVKQFRNIARQYSYFYRIFQTIPEARSWPIKDYFTFDAYRWAVSTVMTRVNRIPSESPSGGQLGLIPCWDMANHEFGQFSTDFNDSSEKITCFAYRKFSASEQFQIYYGQRSNAEFFLNNGFVYKDNPDDSICIKLGVSKVDALYDDKAKLLESLGVPVSGIFHLVNGAQPISPGLLAFARVFSMNKDSLEKWKSCGDEAKDLFSEDCKVDDVISEKTVSFLHTRISLLLKAYPTTLQEDEARIKDMDYPESLVVSLLTEEKKILNSALKKFSSQSAK